jgi:hypothetical protein
MGRVDSAQITVGRLLFVLWDEREVDFMDISFRTHTAARCKYIEQC